MAEHGRAGVAGAAERAGGGGLDAVEELEGSAGGEKRDGRVDDRFIGSVDAGDVPREDEEDDAHGGHERSAEDDGGVARVASRDGIAAAECLADTNGGGGRESEGNHVGEGDGVKSDLMTCLGDGAKTRDESGDKTEDGDFGGELERGGKTKSDEFADAGEVRVKGGAEEFGFVVGVVPEKVDSEDEREIRAGDASSDAGAGHAESGEAEFAENEDVIAGDVDQISGDESEGDGANHVHALERAANSEIEK